MKNIPLLVGTIIGTILLVVGIVFLFSQESAEQIVDQSVLVSENSHIIGSADAPITIVEFSDFQCPACKSIQPLVKQVLSQYEGKVRLVFRHFPLSSIHPHAETAARVSEVAAEEGKFEAMHDKLFETQEIWSVAPNADAARDYFVTLATELGIDNQSFLEKIESDRIKERVTIDSAAAAQLNIQSTPTLYVNGRQTPASQLLKVVESEVNNLE